MRKRTDYGASAARISAINCNTKTKRPRPPGEPAYSVKSIANREPPLCHRISVAEMRYEECIVIWDACRFGVLLAITL